jgi:hypothetical protein
MVATRTGSIKEMAFIAFGDPVSELSDGWG